MPRPPDRRAARALRSALLRWYSARERPLPWRATRDPYGIWVSEVMLQQTRVETVEPYWRRFLAAFPSVEDLAAAEEVAVLAAWSGLGYYRRARMLRAAAQTIVARHGGQFPRELDQARELPGVGPYTAGAVLSIAFDAPEPLVDGNVARVLARVFALEGEIARGATQKELWALAAALVPREGGAGRWNQALMELGALVCLPREPGCGECPWSSRCQARRLDTIARIPRLAPRKEPIDVELALMWVERRGELLLERRGDGGRMAGMWQVPTIEVPGPSGALTGWFAREWSGGARLAAGVEIGELRHGITHHRIRARIFAGRTRGRLAARGPLAWVPRAVVARLPVTGMTRKVLRAPFAERS